jgi:hypothetical protein
MKRIAALLVALVATAGAVVAFLGPCDGPRIPAPTPDAPRLDGPTAAAAPTTSPARRKKSATGAAADDEGERFPLLVRVVSAASNAPIAGAVVEAGDARVATDAAGDATIEGLPRGGIDVEIRARGFIRRRMAPQVPGDDDRLLIELEPGVVVPVEVVDAATGRPLPGAMVTFSPSDDHARRMEFVADDAGRVEANLPPDMPCPVRTKARGHFQSLDFVRTTSLDGAQPTLRVALAPSATLRGVVRLPDGSPAESAVCVARVGGENDGFEIDCPHTESDGSFEVDGLFVGASYTAAAPSQWNWSESVKSAFTATREGAVVELRLRKPGALALTVVDDDGALVDRLEMRLSGDSVESTRSGGGGSVTEALAPGRYVVKVWIQDCVPVSETVDIVEGETMKRRIVLTSGDSIEGIVVDETGAPVEATHISSASDPIDAAAPTPWAATDADGRFRAEHFATGAHDVRVSPPFQYEGVVVRGVAAPSRNARFVVARRGTLALQVVFEGDARPARHARIAFHAGPDDDPFQADRPLPVDGGFEIPWPDGVRGEVGIVVDGFLPVTRTVNVPLGACVDLGEIRLRRGATLAGVLRSEDGSPLSGRTLVLRDVWHGGRSQTDGDGRFGFDGLAPGAAWIDVEERNASFRVDVPSAEPVALVERRPGKLYVALTDAAGAPLSARRVVVRIPDGEPVSEATTDERGVALHSLAPGKFVVEVDQGPRADVGVGAGDVAVMKLRVN